MEDPSFCDTRDSNFLKDSIQAFKDQDVNSFKAAITKLKQFSDLDKWRINMFTKIKTKLEKTGIEDPYL